LDNINNNYIVTDLYIKPTDKHIYVEFRSNHPTIVKKKKKKEKGKAITYRLEISLK
jgi:type II secretory ATPase GspE/PulE/Tfp pilus assembly ATPase PilB-like protein